MKCWSQEYFREHLCTKMDILHELKDETVPKFQCHINHFLSPNYYKKNKEFMALTLIVQYLFVQRFNCRTSKQFFPQIAMRDNWKYFFHKGRSFSCPPRHFQKVPQTIYFSSFHQQRL